jgi:hypothetical protein
MAVSSPQKVRRGERLPFLFHLNNYIYSISFPHNYGGDPALLRYLLLILILFMLLFAGLNASDVWFIPSFSEGRAKCLAISSVKNVSYSIRNITSKLNMSCTARSCYAIVQPIPGGRIYITGGWP